MIVEVICFTISQDLLTFTSALPSRATRKSSFFSIDFLQDEIIIIVIADESISQSFYAFKQRSVFGRFFFVLQSIFIFALSIDNFFV